MYLDWEGHGPDHRNWVVDLVRLEKLSTVSGARFVQAWFAVVKCHAFLWFQGLRHIDPSLCNVMCNVEQGGILCDFDLVNLRSNRHPAHERTGTIPFMAVQLLCEEYWEGQIEREYHHELEALIWILPFVFLRYPKDGISCPGSKPDAWLTSEYESCAKEKVYFWQKRNLSVTIAKELKRSPPSDWVHEWVMAFLTISFVREDLTELGPQIDPFQANTDAVERPAVHVILDRFIGCFEQHGGYKNRAKPGYSYDYLSKLLDDLKDFSKTIQQAEDST